LVDCHKCGQAGHVARDCQWENEVGSRPAWCGECNRDTRLIDHGSYVQRCHRCWAWPAKGTRFHQLQPQHRLCGGCRQIVYEWDKMPCGSHQQLAIDAAGRRMQSKPAPELAAAAARARAGMRGT
jgi:hypothetical protein